MPEMFVLYNGRNANTAAVIIRGNLKAVLVLILLPCRRTRNPAVSPDAAGVEEAAGSGLPDADRGDGGPGGEGHVWDGRDVRVPIEAHATLRSPLQGPSPRHRFPKVRAGRQGSVYVLYIFFGDIIVLRTNLFAQALFILATS